MLIKLFRIENVPLYFLAPEDTYQGLPEAATCVNKVTLTGAPDVTDETAPLTTVEALLRSGYGVRKVISYTTGSGAIANNPLFAIG